MPTVSMVTKLTKSRRASYEKMVERFKIENILRKVHRPRSMPGPAWPKTRTLKPIFARIRGARFGTLATIPNPP